MNDPHKIPFVRLELANQYAITFRSWPFIQLSGDKPIIKIITVEKRLNTSTGL